MMDDVLLQEWYCNKRVLVSGGAGFLGSHLVEMLVAHGAQVTVLDNFANSASENLNNVIEKIQLIQADVFSIDWKQILGQDYDILFHLIGNANVPASVENPSLDFALNLKTTFEILESMRHLCWPGRFVLPSSAAVYGNPRRLPILEDDWTAPISPYGVSKLAAESYATIYHDIYNLKTTSLRLFSVYGPRQRKQVVYDLIRKIIQEPENVQVFGDGLQMRDFIYVKDAVRAMMMAAMKGKLVGEIYNVASGFEYTIQDLIAQITDILDVKPNLFYSGATRPGEPQRWSVNIDRLTGLGFKPAYSLRDGLQETISHIKQEVFTNG